MQPKLPEVVATSPNTAHFMIGVDWMTLGKNGTWSVGVIMLRLLDVPAEVCGKRACSSVLAVINGGKHQSHLTGYMKAICQEVSKHIEGPGDLGVIVEPHPGPGVDGVAPARVEPVRIHGVPVVSIADTPATATLTRGMGHSALKMCYNCNISKPPNPPTEKAPLGYDSPTLQTLPGSNREEYVLIYDVRMKLTHEQIMSRGAPFIHGWSQGDPRVVGCHAQPLLPLLLQHLDARLAHLVPVYHSFMYGLLKHQLDWFMSADGLHINVRREILKRGAAIQSPSNLGRDLGDLANRTGWRMEDYKHWYVHFSPIVLRGNLLPEPYRGLWTALEGAMLHYLTPGELEGSENSATPAGMAAGYAHLKTYAAAVILCFQLRMATTRTSCLLYMQANNVGRTCLFGELWIERDLHDLKSITTSGIPGAQLDAHIAMRVAGHNASKRLLDRAEPEAQQDYKARLKDELTQDGQQALLLGAGSAECPLQNSPGAMMRGCMKAVQDLQKSDAATPWRPWHVKQVFGEVLTPGEAEEEAKEDPRVAGPAPPYPVRYYQRADCNDTIVFSSVYKRPSTRNNTWVSIPFRLDDDKWAIWAGHVQFWVRLEHPKLPGVFLRLAVSRIYLTRPTSHPSCLAATGQAVPRPQQAAGAGAAAEAGGQGGEPPGDGDAAGAAGPSGIGGPQQQRSAKRGVEQAAAGAASTGGARKSQRLADSASQRQADPLPPVEDRLQRSAMGSMHQGYGDEHWYMFDATKIFTVFVTSFEDGEGYGLCLPGEMLEATSGLNRREWNLSVPTWWSYGATSHFKGRHDSEGGVLKHKLRDMVLADHDGLATCKAQQLTTAFNSKHTEPASQVGACKAHRDRAKVMRRECLVLDEGVVKECYKQDEDADSFKGTVQGSRAQHNMYFPANTQGELLWSMTACACGARMSNPPQPCGAQCRGSMPLEPMPMLLDKEAARQAALNAECIRLMLLDLLKAWCKHNNIRGVSSKSKNELRDMCLLKLREKVEAPRHM
ncbi:hypothetical protein QJQ45_019736 [Haematococcus lacustris]|nr:hypothetical protein QJQ45_019736 [Haematococcus lacustris]